MKPFHCIAIVGVGLIGGSVGLAVRARKLAKKVVGAGSRPATLAKALHVGAISDAADDLKTAVAEADLVVVAAPVALVIDQVRQIASWARAGALITDVGSTKAEIVAELERLASGDSHWRAGVHFVGSHPLAGNEKTGPEHANGDLFVGRTVVITPTASTRGEDREMLREFWSAVGAKVLEMSAEEHDRAVAATSHLPHLVASAIAGSTPEGYVGLTASGWQDTTRIAAGDPLLWRQVMLSNRAHLLSALDRFEELLAQWRQALEAGDAVGLERLLDEAKRVRDAVGR
jgi:prephenate dehydrogenase